MTEIDVIRYVVRQHQPAPGEEYDPASDRLTVVHRNPEDPDDPTEFGHTMPLQAVAFRKEIWGLPDYASVMELELRDLERYYARVDPTEDYGVHPLALITQHYFDGPKGRMQSFAPGYVFDRVAAQLTALPATTDGVVEMCLDTVMSGLDDVRGCLASTERQTFPCKGMTGLSTDTVETRSGEMTRMEEQTQRINLVSSKPLDDVYQYVTDRGSELDAARRIFVDHVLVETQVPEIMRKRVISAAFKRGLLEEESKWMLGQSPQMM
jgi:hypothetical protein